MKPFALNLLIVIVSLACVTRAGAAGPSLPDEIRDAVDHFLASEWGEGRYEWTLNSVPGIVSATNAELTKVEGNSFPRGTTIIHLNFENEGKLVRRVPLSIRVMPFAWVPVVRSGLSRSRVLEASDLNWENREVTTLRGEWPSSMNDIRAGQWRMRRTLRAGDILTWSDVEEVPAIVRGSSVVIVAQQGNVEVSIHGKALEDGDKGDLIRVENLVHKRILEARVEREGVVTIERAAR